MGPLTYRFGGVYGSIGTGRSQETSVGPAMARASKTAAMRAMRFHLAISSQLLLNRNLGQMGTPTKEDAAGGRLVPAYAVRQLHALVKCDRQSVGRQVIGIAVEIRDDLVLGRFAWDSGLADHPRSPRNMKAGYVPGRRMTVCQATCLSCQSSCQLSCQSTCEQSCQSTWEALASLGRLGYPPEGSFVITSSQRWSV